MNVLNFLFFITILSLSNYKLPLPLPLPLALAQSENNDKGIKVEYKVQFKARDYNKDFDAQTNKFLNESLQKKQAQINNISFVLKADRENYNFTYTKPMGLGDNNDYGVTGAISRVIDGNGIFTNISKKTSYLTGFDMGVKIDRMISTEDLVWEITKETKMILGFKCQKSIGKLKNKNLAHAQSYPVIAWYANELNLTGGPTPFATLPGIILELETNQAIITAVKYSLGKYKINDFVPKNKIMKYSDFNDYMIKWSEENRAIKN